MASLRELGNEPMRRVAQWFVDAIAAAWGVRVTVTSVRRDRAKQQRLYDQYRKTGCNAPGVKPGSPHCFPAAHPGTSPHVLGIGFDLHLEPDRPEYYAAAGALWESLGLRWGGRFRDPIHFDFWPKGYTPTV